MFIVQFGARRCDDTEVDHVITVNFNDNIVSDSVEKTGLQFVYEVFDYCVGDYSSEA